MIPRRWVQATWIGWLLGIPFVAVLALLGELVGIGGSQALVGAGMGAGVGVMQARALRGLVERPSAWFWACTIGLALPFAASDVSRALPRHPTYSLLWSVAAGGVLVGLWQGFLLRRGRANVIAWFLANAAGWSLAAAAAAGADAVFRAHKVAGLLGALAYLGLIAIGGLVLGLATAPVAARFEPARAAAPAA